MERVPCRRPCSSAGLRFATQAYDFNCATAALQSTKTAALAWNTTHEDPDISADVELIDMYIANLRTHGATSESSLTTCGADNPYDDQPPPSDGGYDHQYACSAGGNPRSLLVVALVCIVLLRRRRR